MNNKKLSGHSLTINASGKNVNSISASIKAGLVKQITHKDHTITQSADDEKFKLQCLNCEKEMVFHDNEDENLSLLYFLSTIENECEEAIDYQWVGYDKSRNSI